MNEGTSCTITVVPRDGTGAEVTSPATLSYQVMASRGETIKPTVLVAWTNMLSPVNTRKIELTSAHNTIGSVGAIRYVIVKGTYTESSVTKTITQVLEYSLTNLPGI